MFFKLKEIFGFLRFVVCENQIKNAQVCGFNFFFSKVELMPATQQHKSEDVD